MSECEYCCHRLHSDGRCYNNSCANSGTGPYDTDAAAPLEAEALARAVEDSDDNDDDHRVEDALRAYRARYPRQP